MKISLSCQQLCNVLERGEVECGIETVLATCMLRLHTDTGVLIAPCKLWTKTKKCIQCSNTVWIVLSFTSTYCLYRDCKELNPKSDKHIAICCTSDRKTSRNSQWGSKTYNFARKKELKLNPKRPTLSEASDVLLLLLSENLHELIKPVSDLRRENI